MVISRGFDDAPFDELLGSKPDVRSDLYSLSATLYFAMTRIRPTDAMTRTVNILDGAADPLHAVCELDRSISEPISKVIMRGLSIKRAERYHSAYEMRMELAAATAPFFDSLTRLPNDVQFSTHLRSTIEQSDGRDQARFAVMLLELDEIDDIFERFAPLLWNEAVFRLSERIRSSVRINDVVGRIAKHTFALILYESGSPSDVLRIAARIQSRISESLVVEGTSIQMKSSAGTSLSGAPGKAADSYLREAATAVKTARTSGSNSSAIY